MNIGIICEYNPFHYGHLHHLNEIKKRYPTSNIILVLSGWITERGELSLIDKFTKADIALYYGVDLVVELPFKYMQSADYFAKGSIDILNKLNCDLLIFGSESNDIEKLKNLAHIQLKNKDYDILIKKYLAEGVNYPSALSKALKDLSGKEIKTPNDILGLCYIKEIFKNKYNIEPISIERKTDYNSKKIEGKITSATSIRELIKNKKRYKKYLPKYSYKNLNEIIFIDDYFDYIKYKIISSNDLLIYQGTDEKLISRMKKYILKSNSLEEFLSLIKTKRYTYNRLKRCLTFILLSITKDECSNLKLEYIRILGFNNKGKKILNSIKESIDIPILSNYDPTFLSSDLKITKILSLNKNIKNKEEFISKEYKNKPIIK